MENKIKIPLRYKAVIQNSIIVAFFTAIMFLAVYQLISKSLLDIKKNETTNIIESQQRELNARLFDKQKLVESLSKNEELLKTFVGKKSKNQNAVVMNILKTIDDNEGVDNVYLINIDGLVTTSVDPAFLKNNFGFRNYFKESVRGKNTYEFALGTITKKQGFYFAAPIFNQGKVLGVAVIKVSADYILSSFDNTSIKNFGYYFFTDRNGVILSTNKNVPPFSSMGELSIEEKKNIAQDKTYVGIEIMPLQYGNVMDLIRNYQNSKQKTEFLDTRDNEQELLEVIKVGNFDYFVVLESNLSSIYSEDKKILQPLLVVMLLVVILGVIVQYFVFQKLFAPLSMLDKYSKNVANGVKNEVININSGDEIENLAKSMSYMVGLLKADNRNLSSIVTEKNNNLVQNLEELEKRNREMDETEMAMINLLEDAHDLEKQLAEEKQNVEAKVLERTKQLSETTARFQHAIDSGPRIFVVFNRQLKVVVHNNKMETILGVKENNWTIEKIDSLLGNKVEVAKKVKDVIERKEVINYRDVEFGNKVLSIYISPIDTGEDKEVIGAVMTVDDVTEKVLMERSKDEFFSIASHELRTPLTAIRGNTSMIQEYYKEQIKDPELSSMITDIHDSSVRLIDIVNDFLNISRLEQGKMEFKKEEVDLVKIVPEIIKEYVDAKLTKNIEILFAPPKEKSAFVLADGGKVKQILVNLIGNSLKFTEAGKITISLEPLLDKIKVLVTDTGRGISIKQQSLLFRKFQQAGESLFTRDTVGGTGLGLYISKKMVEGMGGDIKLESSVEGKGTVFSFSLPSID